MPSASGRRARFLVAAVLALAVLAGGSLYLARGVFFANTASGGAAAGARAVASGCGAATTGTPATGCAGNPDGVALAAPPVAVTGVPGHPGTGPSPSASASPRPASASPSPRPGAPATGPATAWPSAPGGAPSSTSPTGAQDGAAAGQVLALINQARSAAGLPALTVTSGLEASSSAHNLRMAGGCGLSHQCPGEPPLGTRETATGVSWTAAGENIGEGGPVAGTSAAIAQMAVGLTQSMLNEKPPDDGHRLNILSSTFTHIGIAVYRDSSGTVWLTQDFSN
jgi:uncharacterized protein YkwD